MNDTLSVVKVWLAVSVGGVLDWGISDWTEGMELLNTALASVSFTLAIIYTFYKIKHRNNEAKF
jgi:hypothetical protein